MKGRLIGTFLLLTLGACNKNRVIDGDRPNPAEIGRPPEPVRQGTQTVISYTGLMPGITFVQLEKGGEPGSKVYVYVQINGVNVWQEISPSSAVGAGSGQLCYAYDLGGGFGPVVRFMNTGGVVTAYYIYLVIP